MTKQPQSDNEGRCIATKADGSRCRSFSNINQAGLCSMHDPLKQKEWRELRSRGGFVSVGRKKTRPPAAPKTIEDAIAFASWCAWACAAGKLSAAAARAAQAHLAEFRAAKQAVDMGRELADLKRDLAAIRKAR